MKEGSVRFIQFFWLWAFQIRQSWMDNISQTEIDLLQIGNFVIFVWSFEGFIFNLSSEANLDVKPFEGDKLWLLIIVFNVVKRKT